MDGVLQRSPDLARPNDEHPRTDRQTERPLNQDVNAIMDLVDDAVSHIYGAGLLIHTRCDEGGPARGDGLDSVSAELDSAIRQLQAAVTSVTHLRARTDGNVAGRR